MEQDFYNEQQEKISQQASAEVQPASMPPAKKPKIVLLLLAVILLGIGAAGGYFLANSKNSANIAEVITPSPQKISPTSIPTQTMDPETASWKVYSQPALYFSFRYPENYNIISEEPRKVVLGFSSPSDDTLIPYLTVTMDGSSSYEKLTNCIKDSVIPCVKNKESITVNNEAATSVSITGGVDYAYSVVTLPGNPSIELSMNVAGGGLSQTFSNILSTVRIGTTFEKPQTAFGKVYTDTVLPISFKYEFPTYVVSSNIFDGTSLKADREIWVSIPNSDGVLMQIYYYKSSLSAADWWNSMGKAKFETLQSAFITAVNPKPTGITTPSFTTTSLVFAGQNAIQAKGHVKTGQGPQDEALTIVQYKDGIYLIRPMGQVKEKQILEQTINSIKFL